MLICHGRDKNEIVHERAVNQGTRDFCERYFPDVIQAPGSQELVDWGEYGLAIQKENGILEDEIEVEFNDEIDL